MAATDQAAIDVIPARTPEEENEALLRRFYNEIFNHGRLAAADEIVAPDFVDHIPTPLPNQPTTGPEAVRWSASMFRTAFPDLSVTVEDVIAKGETVVSRVTWQGTQEGQLMGADPTHKRVQAIGIDITRVSGGKLVEHWGQMDVLSIIIQLGFLTDPTG